VQDVVALLEMEGLREVVLLGHSYGRMVVTGVADRCAERIRRLVYLDASYPRTESVRSITSCASAVLRSAKKAAERSGNGGRVHHLQPISGELAKLAGF
jgi:pimeloyl-ACP methyl ester carboxylesterase